MNSEQKFLEFIKSKKINEGIDDREKWDTAVRQVREITPTAIPKNVLSADMHVYGNIARLMASLMGVTRSLETIVLAYIDMTEAEGLSVAVGVQKLRDTLPVYRDIFRSNSKEITNIHNASKEMVSESVVAYKQQYKIITEKLRSFSAILSDIVSQVEIPPDSSFRNPLSAIITPLEDFISAINNLIARIENVVILGK